MRWNIAPLASQMLVALFACPLAAAAVETPNIVLIFIDDMGVGDIGPFGNTKIKTPNLDRMAAEGMKFSAFYATPVCSMSRACLMTGCYNARVSIPGVLFPRDNIGLNPDEITLAEIVKQKDYKTICIGKWHLGHREPFLPTKQGFDSYFGIPYSNDMTIDKKHAVFAKDCNFREGFDEAKARAEEIRHTVPLMRGTEVVEYPADQSTLTKRYTEEAVKFMNEHKSRPFFVYLPHSMVHVPLAASKAFLDKSGQGLLGDAVEEIDWSVGQILQTLKDLQLDEKTLVIFTSDNGEATGSSLPYRGKKGSNYEGGVREPCIMRWPGRIPANTMCSHFAGNIDMLPTFAKLIGVEPPADRELDGRDITSLMFDPTAGTVRNVQLYYSGGAPKVEAIRVGDWKYFRTTPKQKSKFAERKNPEEDGPVLYNLANDPYETKNLIAKKPKIAVRLAEEANRREAEIETSKRPAGTIADAE